MSRYDDVIGNLELNIRWICDNPAHQFPGWSNVEIAMRGALNMLDEQKKIIDYQHSALRGSSDMIHLLYEKIDGIVLCKDCKYRGNNICPFYQKYHGEKYDDWFCADGVRSE